FGKLLLSCCCQHEHAPPGKAPADEREQPQAHLVGPVDVLEHQNQRRPRREALDEVCYTLEQPKLVVTRSREASGVRFGQQPGELRPPSGTELIEHPFIVEALSAAQGVHPGPKGENGGALVAATY